MEAVPPAVIRRVRVHGRAPAQERGHGEPSRRALLRVAPRRGCVVERPTVVTSAPRSPSARAYSGRSSSASSRGVGWRRHGGYRRSVDLIEATKTGDVSVVRRVAARGADLDARDAEGRTALFHALPSCIGFNLPRESEELVRALLELGVDPDAVDDHGDTVERWAARGVTAAIEASDLRRLQALLRGG